MEEVWPNWYFCQAPILWNFNLHWSLGVAMEGYTLVTTNVEHGNLWDHGNHGNEADEKNWRP